MSYDYTSTQTDSVDFDDASRPLDPARQLTDLVVENPMPSVLAAAATGAALMALAALVAKPKSRLPKMPDVSMPDVSMPDISMPDVSMPKMSMPKMSMPKMPSSTPSLPDVDFASLKDHVVDLVQRVSDAFPSKRQAKSQLQSAQDTVQDTVQSTWNTVRDQASDMIDQVQPQLAAATKVARDNPLWAALIVGALGTLLGSQLLGRSTSK